MIAAVVKTTVILTLLSIPVRIALAQAQLPAELPLDQEVAALRAAEARGHEIYLHDRAAAVATDAVFALPGIRQDRQLRGWITQAVNDSVVVTFFGMDGNQTPTARYQVTVAASGSAPEGAKKLDTPIELTPFERGAVRARELALATKFSRCSDRYNTVVLPVANQEDRWHVYLIPGTTDYAVIPMGGAHRMEVDVAAGKVVSQRQYSTSCLVLQNDPKAVAMMASHLLDPTPTEIHVFWNLWSRKAMYIVTPPHGTSWGIAGGKVALMERRSK